MKKSGIYRSSHPEVFLGKGVLKICSKFTGEHPCWSEISIKLLKISIKLLYHVISKEVDNHIDWIFRHVCINNPHWQSSGIIIFLC